MDLKTLRRSLHVLKPNIMSRKRATAKPLGLHRMSFLDLPGEIRNEIYEYCLAQVGEPETLYWCNRILPPCPALSCVCKMVRHEYLTLFDSQKVDYKHFKHAKFGVVNLDFEPAAQLVDEIAPKVKTLYHNITITFIFTKAFQPAEAVRKMSALYKDPRSDPSVSDRMMGLGGNGGVGDLTVAFLDYRRFRRTRLWHFLAFQYPSVESRFEKLVTAMRFAVTMPFQNVVELGRGCRR